MNQIEGTIAAYIYEDGKQYLGVADVSMPISNTPLFS